jgi:serine/threonine protein kinase
MRTRRSKRGGAVLGRGGFGCVIHPAVFGNKDNVNKVFEGGDNEITIVDTMKENGILTTNYVVPLQYAPVLKYLHEEDIRGCIDAMKNHFKLNNWTPTYIVELERAEGDLHDFVDKAEYNTIPDNILRKALSKLVTSLHVLHEHRILHGDITMSNILYFKDPVAFKLSDFGNASVGGTYEFDMELRHLADVLYDSLPQYSTENRKAIKKAIKRGENPFFDFI